MSLMRVAISPLDLDLNRFGSVVASPGIRFPGHDVTAGRNILKRDCAILTNVRRPAPTADAATLRRVDAFFSDFHYILRGDWFAAGRDDRDLYRSRGLQLQYDRRIRSCHVRSAPSCNSIRECGS